MLQAAHDIVVENGMSLSLEELSLEDVMRRASVARSSVYRIWPYKDDFMEDLLCHMAGPDWYGTANFNQESMDLAASIVRANTDRLGSIEGRSEVVREAVRQAVAANFDSIVSSADWQIYLAIVTTARTTRDAQLRAKIATALNASETRFTSSMADFYQQIAAALGIRMRRGYRFEHLTLAGSSILEGLAYRAIIGDLIKDDRLESAGNRSWELHRLIYDTLPGPALDGTDAPWSFAASAYLGILEGLTEMDPDFIAPAEASQSSEGPAPIVDEPDP